VSITKVVVFFTTNPTKLVLNFSKFSMIFYAFYKFLQKGVHYKDPSFNRVPRIFHSLADGSGVHGFNPGKISIATNMPLHRRVGSPAAMAGRA
jgi:hypothetical protein